MDIPYQSLSGSDREEGHLGSEIKLLGHEKVHFHWDVDNLIHYRVQSELLRGGRWVIGLGTTHKDLTLCCWDLHNNQPGQELHSAAELVWEGVPTFEAPTRLEAQYHDEDRVNCLVSFELDESVISRCEYNF